MREAVLGQSVCPQETGDLHHVHPSMPNYMQKALKQFQHKAGKLQHAPYQSAPIQYGAKKQYTTQESKAPLLDDKAKRFIQQVCGKFLFPGRAAVDSTLLCPISAIALQSSNQLKTQCNKHYSSLITVGVYMQAMISSSDVQSSSSDVRISSSDVQIVK